MVGEGLLSGNYVQNCTRNRVLKVFEYLTLDCCAFSHRVGSLHSVNPGRCNWGQSQCPDHLTLMARYM